MSLILEQQFEMNYFLFASDQNMPSIVSTNQMQPLNTFMSSDSLYQPQLFHPTFYSTFNSLQEYSNLQTQNLTFQRPQNGQHSQQQTQAKEICKKRRERNAGKELQSAKKNSESNLINHFFSYFNSRARSEDCVGVSISFITHDESHSEKLAHLFYNVIHLVNSRRGRKYVNKSVFNTFFDPEKLSAAFPEIKEKVEKLDGVSLPELCSVFRRCCWRYYRMQSVDAILTSRRISNLAKEEHFRKRRKILQGLFTAEPFNH